MPSDRPGDATYRGFPKLNFSKPGDQDHRYRLYCSNCGERWSPSIGAGFSRLAGSGRCPDCGTDYRVWAAFQRLFAGDDRAE